MSNKGLFYTIWCAVLVGVGSFLYGYDSGIMSSMIAQTYFLKYFESPSSPVLGGITSSLQGGAWISNLFVALLCDRVGRRWTIAFGSAASLLGGILMCAATNTGMLMAGRAFAGIGLGSMMVSCSIYQAEIAAPRWRGTIVGLMQLTQSFGSVSSSWISYGFKNVKGNLQWRLPFGFQIIPPLILLACLPFLPESPRWLISKGHDERALAILKKLSDTSDAETEEEFLIMKENIMLEESQKVTDPRVLFSKPSWRKRVYLASYTWLYVAFSGVNVINYYQTLMYKSLGFDTNHVLLLTGIYGIVGFVAVCISIVFLIDRFGRMQLITPVPLMLAAILLTAALLQYKYPSGSAHPNLSAQRAGVALLYSFTLCYGMVAPITFIYTAEIFPMPIRSLGGSAAGIVHWSGNIIFNQVSPIALGKIGWRYYFVFVGLNLLNFTVFYLFFPETKGRSLEQLNAVFGDPVAEEIMNDEIKGRSSITEDARPVQEVSKA